jgi:arylsulfatase A-like enzyme
MSPNPEDMIIPTYLKEAGYVSAMIGKSGTGCRCKPAHPNEKGFDYFYGYLSHGQAHSYFPKFMHENGKQIDFPNNGGNKTWRGDTYSHDLFLEKALKFLDNNKDQPFFLHYSAALPHAQVYVPDEFKKDYLGKYPEKEFGGKGKRKHYGHTKDPNATTAGMIARLDWEIGKIVEKIEELGLTENTVIMFSSDNGPHQEGGRKPAFFKSSGEYKGIKRDLYDGGVKVPFIVKWPNVINENQVSEHVSAFWDVLPTLTDMAGLRSPDGLDGISFLPTLKGQQQKKHSCLYWEFHERGGKVAVLKDGWKLILMNAKKKKSSFELYNLKNDIHEDHNLAKNYPEKVKEMYELMKSQHEDSEIGKLKFKRFEEVKIN